MYDNLIFKCDMPKFLDQPQWYDAGGSAVYGVGATANTTTANYTLMSSTTSGRATWTNKRIYSGYAYVDNDGEDEVSMGIGTGSGFQFYIFYNSTSRLLTFYSGSQYIRFSLAGLSPETNITSSSYTANQLF